MSKLFNVLFLSSTLIVILLSEPFLLTERVEQGEYYALLLFCTSGMMLLASALDLPPYEKVTGATVTGALGLPARPADCPATRNLVESAR